MSRSKNIVPNQALHDKIVIEVRGQLLLLRRDFDRFQEEDLDIQSKIQISEG